MAYEPIVNVDISINDVNLSRDGFGTPIFISSHHVYDERVRAYSTLAEVGNDFDTTEPAYRAAQRYFGQSPSVSVYKVGRRSEKVTLTLPDGDPADGLTFSVDIRTGTVGDIATDTITYGPTSTDTVQTVLDGLKAAIDASAVAAYVDSVVILNSSLEITPAAGFDILTAQDTVGSFEPLTYVYTAQETAADVYLACVEEDSDFYFVTADDNSITFATGMATSVSTDDRLYFVASRDIDNIAPISEPDNSLFGELQNFAQTVLFFHQDATGSRVDSTYPECSYVGYNAPYDAGSVTWANLRIPNIQESTNYTTGKALTTTEKSRLNDRNANYMEKDSGIIYTRTGRTASGEWIDTIRGVHWLSSEIALNLKNLLLNQQGGKVSYDNQGTARVREVIASALQAAINRRFLRDYELYVPMVQDKTSAQIASRVLDGVTFTGILAGAIHVVKVVGNVTSDQTALSQ